jgi:RNA polymerase sigma-70 factor (ECF subfamily)
MPTHDTNNVSGNNDNDLIARVIANGDKHAFATLVTRHQSQLRASLRKMTQGNLALADDVAQETFILAWKNIGKFRYEAKFSTWLYRIAFNAWQTEVRRKSELPIDDDTQYTPTPSKPESDATNLRRDMEYAMQDLSDAERSAIHHCYYLDLSHDEAAYTLNMPLGTLKTHVLRAKDKMRQRLESYRNDIGELA